uniref:Uncharacterized protein n=1 Tax=Trichobilharzia regenti TaxID=157069 RepID=A0AA85J9P2_TRIRE|nr:unnamed protein product [Trichobilharzia regenti]
MLPLSLNELEDSLIFSVFIRIPTRGFDFIDNMKSTILVAVIVCASIAGVYSDYYVRQLYRTKACEVGILHAKDDGKHTAFSARKIS